MMKQDIYIYMAPLNCFVFKEGSSLPYEYAFFFKSLISNCPAPKT